jgi:hypothetical protein
MEAHAGTVRIPTHTATKSRRRRLRLFLAAARARRRERAIRSHELRASGISAPSIPGSEHTHLLRPRGY